MNLSTQYARALSDLAAQHPDRVHEYLANLRGVLARRGHERLLPDILRALRSLDASATRRARATRSTQEERRTRTLVELYRKLIAS